MNNGASLSDTVIKQLCLQVAAWVLNQKVPPLLPLIHAKWVVPTHQYAAFDACLFDKSTLLTCRHNNQVVHVWTAYIVRLKADAVNAIDIIQWTKLNNIPFAMQFVKHVQKLKTLHVFSNNMVRLTSPLNVLNKKMLLHAVEASGIQGISYKTCTAEYCAASDDVKDLVKSNVVFLHNNQVRATSFFLE